MSSPAPQYRYRGNVPPSDEVSRPVAAYRNVPTAAAGDGSPTSSASATLDIFDVIDSCGGWWGISSKDVDKALAQIGDVDTLHVRLNSPGGEATEGVAIANLLRAHPADVRVTVYGIAASAASIIAVAGETLSMAPGSTLMVHDASGIAFGTATDMQAGLNMLNAVSDSYAALYALKAGGTPADWRAVMRATTWYTPDAAVEAKLADRVGLDPLLPGDLPPVEDDDADSDDDAQVIEIDISLSPAARAAARRFDLSMLPNAPVALAHQTPAEPPVTPTHNTEEADAMSDTLSKGLRERLGVTDESIDEAGLLTALDEALAETAEAAPAAAATDDKSDTEMALLRRELDAANSKIGELVSARASDEASKKAERKRELFASAFAAGKIGGPGDPERVEFEQDYDEAPAVIERILAGRAPGSKFPVKASGYTPDTEQQADPANDDNYWFPGARKPAMTTAGD